MLLFLKLIKFLLIIFLLSAWQCSKENSAPDQVNIRWILGDECTQHSEMIKIYQNCTYTLGIGYGIGDFLCENSGIELSIKIDGAENIIDTIKTFPIKQELLFVKNKYVSISTEVVPIEIPIVCKRLGKINCELIIE